MRAHEWRIIYGGDGRGHGLQPDALTATIAMRPNNQSQGQKRGRNRNNNNNRRGGGSSRQSLDSNGPNVRIRGTAIQIFDKYIAMARDASSSGDRILAESYFQHAEHYYRLANNDQDFRASRRNAPMDDDADYMDGNQSGDDDDSAEAEVEVKAKPSNDDTPESGETKQAGTVVIDQTDDASATGAEGSEDVKPARAKRAPARRRRPPNPKSMNNPADLAAAASGDAAD